MKKILLLVFLFIAVQIATIQAQCNPDTQYMDMPTGIYPIDTLDATESSLPMGEEDQAYEATLTVALPDMVMIALNPGQPPVSLNLDSIRVNNITGLPPGISYECSPSGCLFPDQALNCILLSGTPTQAGTYSLTIEGQLHAFPIAPEITFPGDLLPGKYEIVIDEATSIDKPIKDVIGLGQNAPNPFHNTTEITVDTKQSGQFEFKVYNILGKLLHDERLAFSAGKNVVKFDGSQLHSGMYFYSIGQGNEVLTRRMVVHRP